MKFTTSERDIIQKFINEWDPIKLFPGECAPYDEYLSEVSDIFCKMKESYIRGNTLNAEIISDIILEVIQKSFDEIVDKNECIEISERILSKLI